MSFKINKNRLPAVSLKRLVLHFALVVCLHSIFCTPLWAGSRPAAPHDLQEKVTLEMSGTDAAAVIRELDKQTSYAFSYSGAQLTAIAIEKVGFRRIALEDALQQLERNYGLQFSVNGRIIAVKPGAPKAAPSATPSPAESQPPGRISGKILDDRSQPLPGASVTIPETGQGTQTTVEGTYQLRLPAGTYAVEISFLGFQTRRITGVEVRSGEPTPLDVLMQPASDELSTVTVTAPYRQASVEALYARQKNNAAVSDGISAEQIRLTPDNNAAQVLKRVSGLTVQQDKFVTVRGLSDRYNNVLLNGAALPSTEPNRRNFSFDIIPSGLIDNIVVNKTATPDMPAEFAGGLVRVTTKDIPDENYASITAGSGFNTNTRRTMYSTRRGGSDYLGFDDGGRNWWRDGTWDRTAYGQAYQAGDREKMGEMNRRIPNNWGLYRYNYSPVQNYQLNLGRRFSLPDGGRLGLTFGALYRHDETAEDEERRRYYGDQADFTGSAYQFRSALGGVLNLAYMKGPHKLALRNLYNHLFTSETNVNDGTIQGFGGTGDAHSYTGLTLINDVRQHRLEGEHVLGARGIRFDWSADWVNVLRNQPDTRNLLAMRNPDDPEGYYYYNFAERTGFLDRGSSIFHSYLKENRYNWAANVALPVNIGPWKQLLKAGYAGAYRNADFQSVGMLAVIDHDNQIAGDFDSETKGMADYQLLAPEYFKPGYLQYYLTGPRSTASGDDYTGLQRLHAGYLMLDVHLLEDLRLVGGVRMEQNSTEVATVTFEGSSGIPVDSNVIYDKTDWLPSANLIYSLTPKMNLRLAYSETLSRPDFRERSPFIYYEFKERSEYKGAYGLKDARVRNMDVRYEFYPSAGEVISVSGFYKKFESPVELVVGGTPGGGQTYYYFNLRSSTSVGVELDFRKSLDFIGEGRLWHNLVVSGNGSWMKANVRYNTRQMLNAANSETGAGFEELPPDSRDRPLQGLSPYVINAGIGYTGKLLGAQLSYNRYGRRIVAGGLYPYADQYENPRDVLDLQLNTRLFKERLDVRLNLSDLLQQDFIIYDNVKIRPDGTQEGSSQDPGENVNNDPEGTGYNPELDYTRYKSFRGSNISLGLTYHF